MRHFSLFSALYYSFFSRSLFADVGRSWGAKAFVYLLLLVALSWIPFMFGVVRGWSAFLENEAPEIIEQIPPITIKNGQVTADVEQPHLVKTSEPDEVFAIIDTTGQIKSLEGTSALLLLTDSQLIARKNDAETRAYDLSAVQDFYMDGPEAEKWLRLFGTWGLVFLYPAAVLGSYVYRLVQALFYSLFGLMIARGLQCKLLYGNILKVMVVALTPAIVLKTLLGMLGVSFPFSWILYFLIAMSYLTFGLSATRGEATPQGEVTS